MSDLVRRSELLEAYDKAHVGPPGGALTDTQKEIIRVFAESGMNRTEASRRLFKHYNTVYYQLIRIKEKTGLNPWDFFDLHELLRMAGVADYVDVVRCKDCDMHSKAQLFGDGFVYCDEHDGIRSVDSFCSEGRRRTDEPSDG